MRWFKFLFKNSFLNYLKVCGLGVAPSAPCYTGCELVRYEYDNGEERFQEQLQLIYSKQKLQKFCHVTTTKSLLAINRVIRAITTLQLGSPSDCQPCCHRNGSSKRNQGLPNCKVVVALITGLITRKDLVVVTWWFVSLATMEH